MPETKNGESTRKLSESSSSRALSEGGKHEKKERKKFVGITEGKEMEEGERERDEKGRIYFFGRRKVWCMMCDGTVFIRAF